MMYVPRRVCPSVCECAAKLSLRFEMTVRFLKALLSELYLSTVSVRPLTSRVRMSFYDRLTGRFDSELCSRWIFSLWRNLMQRF